MVQPGSGWSGISATSINDNGAIVGTATYTQNGQNDSTIANGTHGILLLPISIERHMPDTGPVTNQDVYGNPNHYAGRINYGVTFTTLSGQVVPQNFYLKLNGIPPDSDYTPISTTQP